MEMNVLTTSNNRFIYQGYTILSKNHDLKKSQLLSKKMNVLYLVGKGVYTVIVIDTEI